VSGQPNNTQQFDVFLSHNSRENPAVEAMAYKLHAEGLTPWLDKKQLIIPVLLSNLPDPFDSNPLPTFLLNRTWVDFRPGLDDPAGKILSMFLKALGIG